MPLTPFHFGPAIFIGIILFNVINFPTFLIANVITDIEPFLILSLGLEMPLHGFFHSFLGGAILAVIFSIIMIAMQKPVQEIMKLFKLEQKINKKKILFSAFAGIYLHIIMDSMLYTDIKPFFPLQINPFCVFCNTYGKVLSGFEVYAVCIILFLIGFVLCARKLLK